MEKGHNDIEDLFKESFDDFQPEVKPTVWENVRTGLKWGGVGLFIKFLVNKVGTSTLIALASSALTVVATVFVMGSGKEQNNDGASAPADNQQATQTEFIQIDTVYQIVEKIVEKPATSNPKVNNNVLALAEKAEKAKLESIIHSSKDKEITYIYASPISGPVPLIVDLKNLGTGKYPKWQFGDGKKASTDDKPIHIFETPGTYTIQLNSISADGIAANDVVTITVTGNSSMEEKPRMISFSPNGDGVADVFNLKSKNMATMHTKIYDQKSKLVYQWEGNDGEWNGKNLQGYNAKADTYYYIIIAEGVDGKKYDRSGMIKLER
jgi:gliding motility-associated-like protein